MMTMHDHGARKLAGKRRIARGWAAGRARRLSLLVLTQFIAAGSVGRPAYGQSQTKEVRERCKHATVEVFTKYSKSKEGDTPFGSGSGYFINRSGLCITNNHVVDPGHGQPQEAKFKLKYDLGRLVWEVVVDSGTPEQKIYRGDVLYQNERADQALLQVRGEDGEYLQWPHFMRFFPGRKLSVGQKAWCYGFPGGDSRKSDKDHPLVAITDGHIVDLPRRPDGAIKMIWTDVLANPGNSGGPFVDIDGLFLGTLTLGGQTEARTNTTKLVPADLTKELITTAFQRGKLGTGIDLEPFYTHLVGRDGFVDVPGFPRQSSTDCLFLENGNRICGAPVGNSITLPTPLGELTLPCAQMAYLLRQDDDNGIILMDGGQRLPFRRTEAKLKFKPTGGETLEQKMSELRAVAFRKTGDLPVPPRGKNLLISGDNYYLLLKEVSGEASFASEVGMKMARPLQAISTIETTAAGNRLVHFTDGSQVVGEFEKHEIKAVLAINGAPQTISLAGVRDATIDEIESEHPRKREIELTDLFSKASPDLQKLAEQLTAGKVAEVKSKLAPQLNPEVFNKQGTLKKDQLRLLEAMCDWTAGDFEAAGRGFKKLKSSDDEGIKWFAQARIVVLEKFPDGKFDGLPLSDPKLFKKAGATIAQEVLHRARELLGEREAAPPENRGLFMRVRKQIESVTDDLIIASQLGNDIAGTATVWMWSWEARLLENEGRRIMKEIEEKNEELKGLQGAAKDYTGRRIQKDIEELQKNLKTTEEWNNEVNGRMQDLGFIIDDPDLDLLG
ncbi:MAG: trypsin-like peptidase domain-containing protein [Planctomycetota bacterium]